METAVSLAETARFARPCDGPRTSAEGPWGKSSKGEQRGKQGRRRVKVRREQLKSLTLSQGDQLKSSLFVQGDSWAGLGLD